MAADSATAAIFASGLSGMAPPGTAQYMALVGVVALLTAALLLVARLFKLGFLSDFLSRTVLVGFLAGVGVQVGVAVLGEMLGITVDAHRTVEQLAEIYRERSSAERRSRPCFRSRSSRCLFAGQRWAPRFPVSLLAVVARHRRQRDVGLPPDAASRSSVRCPAACPRSCCPTAGWERTRQLLPIAVSCFVIIIAQSSAASRVFALASSRTRRCRCRHPRSRRRERRSGRQRRIRGEWQPDADGDGRARRRDRARLRKLVAAMVVVFVLLFLTGPLQYLPRFVLAAIVFNIAIGLIDWRGLAEIRRESPANSCSRSQPR